VTIRTDKPRAGFSLVELLLTLVLILCIAAASVFTFTTLYRSANLDEGYDRFQSLIRFAQAEAATTGRKVRLQFPAHALSNKSSDTEEKTELRDIQVTWEADALNAPGVFQTYTNKSWSEEIVNELVGVQKVQSIQSPSVPEETALVATLGTTSREETSPETASSESGDFPAITFYPDGSCDSAEIVLASRNPDDERRMEVRLSGMLGSVSSRTISSEEADAGDIDDAEAAAEFDEVFSSPQTTTALSDTTLN
jgi:prepilin-type N-terminal cleavage/methylation domain-containing protein